MTHSELCWFPYYLSYIAKHILLAGYTLLKCMFFLECTLERDSEDVVPFLIIWHNAKTCFLIVYNCLPSIFARKALILKATRKSPEVFWWATCRHQGGLTSCLAIRIKRLQPRTAIIQRKDFRRFSVNWIRRISGFSFPVFLQVVMGKGVLASLRGESNDPFTLNNVKGCSRVSA